jgi:putative iron-regulated protein
MTSFTRGLLMSALTLLLVSLAAPRAFAQTAQTVDSGSVARHYAAIVQAGYDDTLAAALDLQKAVQAFNAQPSPASLDAARKAWLAAREWYGQTEAFRFYGGPIDDDNGPEGRLNAWPMDEAYVDGVKGKAAAGLINDTRVLISKANLIRYNERGGEENIAAGWHAIEFLLWGQDLSADGPGNRNADEFVDGKAPHADRRRQYLAVATELLVDDLRYLVGAWVSGAANYRAGFERGDIESLRRIIVGIGSLSRGELAGERMEVALNTQDQEDEHSCFSDNTHRDIVNNALGIENVWLGRYQRRDGSTMQGPSLRNLVAARDPALAERTTKRIAGSLQDAKAIQPPFDREITGGADAAGRQRVQKTVDSLVAQSKDLADAAAAIGITRLTLVNPKQ